MTRNELIEKIAQAIAEMEGFYRSATQPTLAQRNANPGNLRQWRDRSGKPYPTFEGLCRLCRLGVRAISGYIARGDGQSRH
jgi:hypothetical protein